MPDYFSPELLSWLEQRGGAYLVAALWISMLLRDRTHWVRRSEKLSDALCRSIESGSAERSRLSDEFKSGHDWTVRSLLDHFRQLSEMQRPSHTISSRPPTKTVESESPPTPRPPPLPHPPPTPKRPK